MTGLLLGAHVPTSGGVPNAPANGRSIAATAIQIFTRNQMQWRARPLDPAEATAFRRALAGTDVRMVLSHASYLINLAATNSDFLARSRETLAAEIQRCHAFGIPHVVFHPGAHMGAGERAGLKAVAASLDDVLMRTRDLEVMPLLEVTAGQGSCLGDRFEHLAEVLSLTKAPERLGVCLDTCHLLAAGYDIASARGYERTLREFDRLVGLHRLKAIHLNDSARPLGSRVDRHTFVGRGFLGLSSFERLLRDPRLAGVPMVLETPGSLPVWKREIALLRRLAAGRRARRRRAGRAARRAR